MNFYLNKYGFQPPVITSTPANDLGLIVVIPCFNEPDIQPTLNSLNNCLPPHQAVEIIIVINSGTHHDHQIKAQNDLTVSQITKWKNTTDLKFDFHVIEANDLPKKHAGVGLARKIGMDEAVSRFHSIGKDGIIVCFDADSQCQDNYLRAIEQHFTDHPKTPGCAIRYEHPVEGDEFDQPVYNGIINYELFLRYYNIGLQYAKLPFSYHTVGSSMAIRSSAYQKQGGMNKRKAGEDFYFLHKIIALGNFTALNTTKVIPSPRTSDRVPFGTGKAINDWLNSEQKKYLTYDFRVWEMLKSFVATIPQLRTIEVNATDFYLNPNHQVFIQFLNLNNFSEGLKEIRKNSTSPESFQKRFFVWFNAFRVLKLVHYIRDEQYPDQPIYNQARLMAESMHFYNGETDELQLLKAYRTKEYKN